MLGVGSIPTSSEDVMHTTGEYLCIDHNLQILYVASFDDGALTSDTTEDTGWRRHALNGC